MSLWIVSSDNGDGFTEDCVGVGPQPQEPTKEDIAKALGYRMHHAKRVMVAKVQKVYRVRHESQMEEE